MTQSWLMVADDLTGAADCAISFARSGMLSSVVFGEMDHTVSMPHVVSVDTASRQRTAEVAADIHRKVLEKYFKEDTLLYKKTDSTIRGQPAAELAETITFLKERGKRGFAVVTPAFPATGRTVERGSVLLDGKPLEESSLWKRDHTYKQANLVGIFEDTGLKTVSVSLEKIREGELALSAHIRQLCIDGYDVAVFDTDTDDDMDILADVTLPMQEDVFWVGSGGLAASLARKAGMDGQKLSPKIPESSYGVLTVVGSLSEISRNAADQLASCGEILHISVPPEIFLKGDMDLLRLQLDPVGAALRSGRNVLVDISLVENPNLALGQKLAGNLAQGLKPNLVTAGGLVLTGGDTAAAVLMAAGVGGIELVEEIESGVPLGITMGSFRTMVVTKAGGFGTCNTLESAVTRICQYIGHNRRI